MCRKKLPADRYAVTTHKGSRDNIGDTIYRLYGEWLPNSNEELADLPCIFTSLLNGILVLQAVEGTRRD
ncbi:MAG: GyrI-like domain-containing protein [Microcoleus sp. SM1_3_4]|nr:GyrI-like domain-containing protein [Microcoleus sp. SM1_3_4]